LSTEKIILNERDRFAIYSLPGEKQHVLIQQTNTIDQYTENILQETGFIFHPFTITSKTPSIYLRADEIFVNPNISFTPGSQPKQQSTLISDYMEIANKFINATGNRFRKLVLSRIEVMDNSEKDIFDLFIRLKEKYPDAFCYLFNHPDSGSWMGASPEVFLEKRNNQFTTISLAGTRKSDHSGNLSAPWTDKEKEEQQIVSDFIQLQLEELGISFKYTGPVDQRAGNLFHLKSKFEFNTGEDKISKLVGKLHPTPAVCGLPKMEAMEYIKQNESHSRDYYTGFLGPVNIEGKTSLFVNLRCFKLSNSQFVLYLGGGITASSNAAFEWKETEDKSETIKAVLK
jgi:isochorismate synthase